MRAALGNALLCAALLGAATPAQGQPQLREASGVVRLGDHLLLVGDNDPGAIYRFRFPSGVRIMEIDGKRLERIAWPWAALGLDPESVDVLADGRIVVLSERLRGLYGAGGLVAQYDKSLSQFAGIGLEGLAVRALPDGSSQVAVLWEGGYPDANDAPKGIRKELRRESFLPVLLVHRVAPGANPGTVHDADAELVVRLRVPEPEGKEPDAQRFRAPDLVWQHTAEAGSAARGILVLLTSGNGAGNRTFEHTWLLRFDLEGRPQGEPFDLKNVLPETLRDAHWEGMGWFEPGARVVLVHDEPPRGDPYAVIVDLPADWR